MATCGFLRSNCSVILMSHKDKGPPFCGWVIFVFVLLLPFDVNRRVIF